MASLYREASFGNTTQVVTGDALPDMQAEIEKERAEIKRQRLLSVERRMAKKPSKEASLHLLKRKIRLVMLIGVLKKLHDEVHEFHKAHSMDADEPLEETAKASGRDSQYQMVADSYREFTGSDMPAGMTAAEAMKKLQKMLAMPEEDEDEEEEQEAAAPEAAPPTRRRRQSTVNAGAKSSIFAIRLRRRARVRRETLAKQRDQGLPVFDADALALLQASFREVTRRRREREHGGANLGWQRAAPKFFLGP